MEKRKSCGINPIPAASFADESDRIALFFVGVYPQEDFSGATE